MSGNRMGRVNERRWFSYKSSYNREVLRRSVNRKPLRNLVEPIGIEPTTS
jgi:hypothetical protein